MICQRSTLPGLPSWRAPERRRLDVAHPARHRRGALAMRRLERRFGDGAVADARSVHEGLVREIHQVVEHQAIVALDANGPAVAGPGRVVVPVQVGDQGGIGERRIAGPHPDEAMPLGHRIGAHAGAGIDRFLRRHERAAALRVVGDAVIAAHDLVALEPALRERQQAMPAGVLERDRAAVGGAPVEHELLVADRAGEQRVPDLVVPGDRIPRVERKAAGSRHRSPPPVAGPVCP